MNKNIIDFYMYANRLKNVVRTGWKEVGIPSEKIESDADHLYGSLILALSIITEKNLNLDLKKVMEMILIRDMAKAYNNEEVSITSSINNAADFRKAAVEVLGKLENGNELISLFDEYESKSSEEAKFVYKVCKLESDLQAKIYEQNGDFTVERAIEDVKNYPEDIKEKVGQIAKASDGWLIFDREYYDDELFMGLSRDIQEL